MNESLDIDRIFVTTPVSVTSQIAVRDILVGISLIHAFDDSSKFFSLHRKQTNLVAEPDTTKNLYSSAN